MRTRLMIERRIVAIHVESADTCVVELACGHRRHVRDRPPFESYPWVRDEAQRTARIGQSIECGSCDRLERPTTAVRYREGAEWTTATIPAALLRQHTLKAGVWGELVVLSGKVVLRYAAPIDREQVLTAGEIGIVPPEVPHELAVLEDARVRLDFYR